jgi:hypothetical protein
MYTARRGMHRNGVIGMMILTTVESFLSITIMSLYHIPCSGLVVAPILSTSRPPFLVDHHSHYSFKLTCTTNDRSTHDGQCEVRSTSYRTAVISSIADRPESTINIPNEDPQVGPNELLVQPPMCKPSSLSSSSSWKDRLDELIQFKAMNGHTRVPKRYSGGLGVWVDHQRQRKGRLDGGRIHQLDAIGFCWDASMDKSDKERKQWWNRFRELQQQQQQQQLLQQSSLLESSSSLLESLSPSQVEWLRRQRNEYIEYHILGYTTTCRLDDDQIQALNGFDSGWWKTSRERQWDDRCQELLEYKNQHGKVWDDDTTNNTNDKMYRV